jgi:hypothetical protein
MELRRFDAAVAPILLSRCVECHNPADLKGGLDLTSRDGLRKGGDSGEVIAERDPAASLLWQRIEAGDMPPKKPLSEEDAEIIREWIAAGAVFSKTPLDPLAKTTSARAGRDWWSLQPIRHPSGPLNIDALIEAKRKEIGVAESAPTNRRVLIRRLTIDLIGMLPTPEEIADFESNQNADAYQRLVDRLLASPRYGERWARHWLDLARYGESNGFEHDEPRYNSWPYRDWVIRALNEDMPYDEFARRQLAGDVMPSPDIAATGFLVAGAYDRVGQEQQSAAMRAVVRQDELEDMVGAVGQTFLGLTVNCARCHDHKFDPIKQTEYYQIAAALAGVRHGERDIRTPDEIAAYETARSAAKEELQKIQAEVVEIERPIRERLSAELRNTSAPSSTIPQPAHQWDFCDAATSLRLEGGAKLEPTGLKLDGAAAFAVSEPLSTRLKAKTLEVWATLANFDQRGGGLLSLEIGEGAVFDAITFAELEPRRWMAGSEGFRRYQSLHGDEETAQGEEIHFAIVYHDDGRIEAFRNGQLYGKAYKSSGVVEYKPGEYRAVFGLRHSPANPGKMFAGVVRRAHLHDRALSAEEIKTSGQWFSAQAAINERLNLLTPEARSAREELLAKGDTVRAFLSAPAPIKLAYANRPGEAGLTHLLRRGNPGDLGEVVAAGGIGSLTGPNASFGLAPDAPDVDRRLALARWVTSADNPLFARTIVNRIWRYHFGGGLVDSPSDLGFNGGAPTHPELLDALAADFVDSGFKLKDLHRKIVLSRTYQQSSAINDAAMKIDADNRYLWRKSPARLDAEVVRDSLLQLSGELNLDVGGPSFKDFEIVVHKTSNVYPAIAEPTPEMLRRSIYRMWARGGRNDLLDAFDCPDPSTTAPKRAVTTTPLQVLSLLNNSFSLRMAEKFAARVKREVGDDAKAQSARAIELALGRKASDEELELAAKAVREQGLFVLTRALINSNEFLFVE